MRPTRTPLEYDKRWLDQILDEIRRELPLYGSGSPEGEIVASIGTLYLRRDGGAGTTLYVKESGNGLASGWVAK